MNKNIAVRKREIIAPMCLVAGTCVGGGMLALPVATGAVGFGPSLVVMIISWLFMTITGLLLMEASLWLNEEAHIITMSSRLLGPIGKVAAWIIYLFIAYASLVAYISGGGDQIAVGITHFFSQSFLKWQGSIFFAFFFGLIIFIGRGVVGRINTILFSSMILAYFTLIGTGYNDIEADFLLQNNWSKSFFAVPLLLTIFSYSSIVPSLKPYLKSNAHYLRIAIVAGTTLTLIIYIIWEYFILGTIPATGDNGLIEALNEGHEATFFLKAVLGNRWFVMSMAYFSFFAIITSFLGIGLGLFDFLADGLKIRKKGFNKVWLILLVVVPALFFAITCPRAFYIALNATGGFGDTILFGIMPALMVWVGRYRLKWQSQCPVPGGRKVLVFVILFSLAVIVLEFFELRSLLS